jgi:predicted anti-sigma-YlaC factor YlaD
MDDQEGIHFLSHPSEDEWEEYAFGRLRESRAAHLEEHLLACTSCQSTLERVDQMIHSLRAAQPQAIHPPTAIPFQERWIPFRIRPAMALSLGGIFVLAVGIAVLHPWSQPSRLPIAFIALASFRGESSASAPINRPLDLEISQSDVPPPGPYSMEVATTSGDSAWKGTGEITGPKIVGHVSKGLGKGTYWVRLYGSSSELIREFGLRVE